MSTASQAHRILGPTRATQHWVFTGIQPVITSLFQFRHGTSLNSLRDAFCPKPQGSSILGWLTPVTMRANILIQSAWLKKLDWDAPLPSADALSWRHLLSDLPCLNEIRVSRWLGSDGPHTKVELYGFADASERGYAAVVYLRSTIDDHTSVHLLAAKGKVAPVKPVSLPRLELCAASLLTNLTHHTRTILGLSTAPVFLWSDSKVTLCWIHGHASRWKTYVANRVSQIQDQLPEARWRHVPGQDNPADCASRGVHPVDLIGHPLWWTGPS